MKTVEYKTGRLLAGRLPFNEDLLEAIEKYIAENNITHGAFTLIGALKSAAYGFYDEKKEKYDIIKFDKQCEILCCTGNVSIKEGKPFVHAHITLGDKHGKAFGGHLVKGCVVFAGEIILREMTDVNLVREYDENTRLYLWRM